MWQDPGKPFQGLRSYTTSPASRILVSGNMQCHPCPHQWFTGRSQQWREPWKLLSLKTAHLKYFYRAVKEVDSHSRRKPILKLKILPQHIALASESCYCGMCLSKLCLTLPSGYGLQNRDCNAFHNQFWRTLYDMWRGKCTSGWSTLADRSSTDKNRHRYITTVESTMLLRFV